MIRAWALMFALVVCAVAVRWLYTAEVEFGVEGARSSYWVRGRVARLLGFLLLCIGMYLLFHLEIVVAGFSKF
jgi:hypothetical protein